MLAEIVSMSASLSFRLALILLVFSSVCLFICLVFLSLSLAISPTLVLRAFSSDSTVRGEEVGDGSGVWLVMLSKRRKKYVTIYCKFVLTSASVVAECLLHYTL